MVFFVVSAFLFLFLDEIVKGCVASNQAAILVKSMRENTLKQVLKLLKTGHTRLVSLELYSGYFRINGEGHSKIQNE